jgi:hypothetical protein
MTEDERYSFREAALKNKTTVQDVLYKAVKRYIADNGDPLRQVTDLGGVAVELPEEV